jgi:predicted ATPase/DNA-binding XRE family transcriptional regulator
MSGDRGDEFPGFGEVLRQHRLAAGLTQEELAERAGLSERGISDLERGARNHPHRATVGLLADALGLRGMARATFVHAAPRLIGRTAVRSERAAAQIPMPMAPLLGRQQERAELATLLRDKPTRLVTLTGPGGVGKTRLALQAAADLWEDLPEGVSFVDLSPLADPLLVLPAVGAVLGAREGEITAARLSAALGDKQLLLVLDNFERVVEAAPLVADLLWRSPNLKVLVTSRVPLHVYGEQEYPVAPFPLPDPAHLPPLERLIQYEAMRLFVDRAHAVKPDFAVTDANGPAVAEICTRLDGLPLAIELAAARIKVLPAQALLKRLEQRLPLLTGGARTIPARQQTMRDAIAWSHDLLSPEEQIVFRRLAIFPGGCTIDAAEAVTGVEAGRDVFTSMVTLVDHSLLRQDEGAEGEPRFRMLETIREYGLDQLGASNEVEDAWSSLAAWCLSLAEASQPDVPGATMLPQKVARFHEELPNVFAAVTWLLDHGESTKVLRLLAATENYWLQQQRHNPELYRWLETALSGAPDAPATDLMLAHWHLAHMNVLRGEAEDARVHAERALLAAQASGEALLRGMAQYALGIAWEYLGDLDQAAAAMSAAIPLLRKAGFADFAWYVQADLADKRILLGDLAGGAPMIDEALQRLQQSSTDWFVVIAIAQRGHAALWQGDLPGAAHWFTESIHQARTQHQTRTVLSAVTGLAGAALARGQAKRAARLLGAVEAAREALGLIQVHHPHHAERITADTRAALEPVVFAQAWATGRNVPLEAAISEALTIADETEEVAH